MIRSDDDFNCYQWGDPLLNQRAGEVLAWGLKLLNEGSFERGDYKQLLILTVVWLGGKEVVEGPQVHARDEKVQKS